MLRSMLIGLDGSSYSRRAADLGIDWARRFGAAAAGLAIVDQPAICHPEMTPIGAGYYKEKADETRLAKATRHVEKFLADFAAACTQAGVSFQTVKRTGTPHEQILLEGQRHDLILLGKETYFLFATQDEACDSLHRVLKNAPRPVVRVPESLPAGKAVLLAYDGSVQAARALHAFQTMGLDGAGDVHVVTIGRDAVEASAALQRAVDFLTLHGIQAKSQVIASTEDVAKILLDQARQLNAGLLVMGAYGQSAIKEFFLGSVTHTILKNADIPLFLYH